MDDDSVLGNGVSRREAMKTALKVGAYAAPVILSASIPATVAAQVTGPTGTLTGTITSSASGLPISGAVVSIGCDPGAVGGCISATTNASGVYTLANVPAGTQTVRITATSFSPRTDAVVITAPGTTTFSTALVPASASGNITIVLTWGATPEDLDSHLTGPKVGGGRFHTYYGATASVPYATLDVDDTNGFGPETITVSPVSGLFVPGEYRYYVHNYDATPEFNASVVRVAVFKGGVQLVQYLASAASGSVALDYWLVFNFTLTATADGGIVLTLVQQYSASGAADVLTAPPRKR